MQYRIHCDAQAPDLARLNLEFTEADPSAILDFDAGGGVIRVSTVMYDAEIIAACAAAGLVVAKQAVERLPSNCCGGCSG